MTLNGNLTTMIFNYSSVIIIRITSPLTVFLKHCKNGFLLSFWQYYLWLPDNNWIFWNVAGFLSAWVTRLETCSTDISVLCLLFFHILHGTLNVDKIKLKCITFHVSLNFPKKLVDIAQLCSLPWVFHDTRHLLIKEQGKCWASSLQPANYSR